jgi:hypothetical protein
MADINLFEALDGRIDKDNGVIKDVSLITMGDARGHGLQVDAKTLEQLKASLDSTPSPGIKAKLNHKSGVEAVFGYINNFSIQGNKLKGDLNLLQHHKDYNQTMEQISTMPGQIGLSVAFQGDKEPGKDGKIYARCKRIVSVDLVADPAANPDGMFETKVDKENHYMNEPQEAGSAEALLEQINERLEGLEGFQSDLEEAIADQYSDADYEDADAGDYEEDYDHEDDYDEGDDYEAQDDEPVEYSSIDDALTYLEAKAEGALKAEEALQEEAMVGDLEAKFEELVNRNEELLLQNEELKNAIEMVEVSPLPSSAIENLFGVPSQEGSFAFSVQSATEKNDKPYDAIRDAVSSNPDGHRAWLVEQGVLDN